MTAVLLSVLALLSTLAGGAFALRNQKWLHLILGYTAGVLLGVVAFDLLPEISGQAQQTHTDIIGAMIALVIGFLFFHILEKSILLHQGHEAPYHRHKHPHVGVASALALSGHSFLDGVGIGLGFQVSNSVGIAVTVAVIAHDFTDGLNTVILMLASQNSRRLALKLLLIDAVAPVLGAASTLLYHLPASSLLIYLGFFAGFLLYIGASDILPQAHSQGSSRKTIGLTVLGVVFMFVITRLT